MLPSGGIDRTEINFQRVSPIINLLQLLTVTVYEMVALLYVFHNCLILNFQTNFFVFQCQVKVLEGFRDPLFPWTGLSYFTCHIIILLLALLILKTKLLLISSRIFKFFTTSWISLAGAAAYRQK